MPIRRTHYGTTTPEFDSAWKAAAGRFLPGRYYFLGLSNIPLEIPDWTKPEDGNMRIFKQDWLEALTVVKWYAPLIVFGPIAAGLVLWGLSSGLSWANSAALFAGGVATWTVSEYFMHRFFFHFVPRNRFEIVLMFFVHGVHHAHPDDPGRLVMPPTLGLILAAPFFLFFRALLGSSFAPALGGFYFGYLMYDMTHYAVHHWPIPGKIFNAVRKHHMLHHFATPDRRFGVSTPLWDFIFKTRA